MKERNGVVGKHNLLEGSLVAVRNVSCIENKVQWDLVGIHTYFDTESV